MNKMFTQPTGPVAKQTNKQAIARVLGIKQSAVGYLSTDAPIDSYMVLYDATTQTSWFRGSAIGTPVSWSISDDVLTLITGSGIFQLLEVNKPIASYELLQKVVPIKEGQVFILTSYYSDYESAGWLGPRGGGKFVAISGSATDDGGYICQPTTTSDFHLQRIASEINLFDFGVKFSDRTVANGAGLRETSTELQNAIDSAIANKLPLVSSAFVLRSGYANGQSLYVTKGIDITGLKELRGILSLVYKPSLMTTLKPKVDDDPNGWGYVVLNTNWTWNADGKVYSTSMGEQSLDTITCYSLEGRNPSYPMHGQLHGFSGSRAKMLASVHNYGYGTRFADCYDSIVDDARGLFSGLVDETLGVEYPGVSINSYTAVSASSSTDESNALTINGLMAHNCYDLAWVCSGTKNNINRVHEEATYVTTTWRKNASSTLNNNGYGYYNSAFTSYGGQLGTLSVASDSSSSYDHVFTAMPWATDFGELQTSGNVGCPAGYSTVGGSIASINAKNLFIKGNARVVISRVQLTGNLTNQDDASSVLSGNINGTVTSVGSASFKGLTVAGAFTVSSGLPKIDGCTLNGVNTLGGTPFISNSRLVGASSLSGAAQVNNCNFGGTLAITGAADIANSNVTGDITCSNNDALLSNVRGSAAFTGGGSLTNCRFTGAVSSASNRVLRLNEVYSSGALNITGTDIQVYIQGGRYDSGTIDPAATGIWQFMPCPIFNSSFGTWKDPTVVSGIGRMTINPLTLKIRVLLSGAWSNYAV